MKNFRLVIFLLAVLFLSAVPSDDREKSIRMPRNRSEWRDVSGYEQWDPDPDYRHASQAAYNAFYDTKFGIRIHWGIYSIWQMQGESWGFLKLPFSKRQEYQELYKTWDPQGFSAEAWVDLFEQSGIRLMAFTTKHHEGFSMFDTKTRVKRRARWAPGETET